MTNFDRAGLERVLPAVSGQAEWADVIARFEGQRHRRRRLLVALVVATTAIVGAASAFGVRTIILDGGATALPPAGATPSTPETGEVVIHYYGRPGMGHPPVHQVWVYADGRLIWRNEAGPLGVADGTGAVRTGFLEQRLTPEGVELLRSEVISTGLFDRDRALLDDREWFWGIAQVRYGDRLASVEWSGPPVIPADYFQGREEPATPEQATALLRLSELLADPVASLPASAWEDEEIKAYVPSQYAICYWTTGESTWRAPQLLEPSRVLDLLPAAAQGVLRGKDRAYKPGLCSEVTTEEARALAEAFSRAGFEHDPLPPMTDGAGNVIEGSEVPQGTWGNARFWTPASTAADMEFGVSLAFEPILPHGQWEQMGG